MSQKLDSTIAVVGIDIGKNSFHVVGHDGRGAIVLRQKWSRGQVEARFANMPPCLIAWKRASARIISAASSESLATMPG
jgi:transposase